MKQRYGVITNNLDELLDSLGCKSREPINDTSRDFHNKKPMKSAKTDIKPWEDQRILDLGYRMSPFPGWMYVCKGNAPKHSSEEISKLKSNDDFSMDDVLAIASEDYKIFVHPQANQFMDVVYKTLEILEDEDNVGMKYYSGEDELQNPKKEKIIVYVKGKDNLSRLLKKLSDGLEDFGNQAETRGQPPFTVKYNDLIFYRQGDANLRRKGFLEGHFFIGREALPNEILSRYFKGENFSLFR